MTELSRDVSQSFVWRDAELRVLMQQVEAEMVIVVAGRLVIVCARDLVHVVLRLLGRQLEVALHLLFLKSYARTFSLSFEPAFRRNSQLGVPSLLAHEGFFFCIAVLSTRFLDLVQPFRGQVGVMELHAFAIEQLLEVLV